MPASQSPEEWWRRVLTGDNPDLPLRQFRNLWRRLPEGPRCQFCNAPYHGIGAPLMKLMGKAPSRLSPHLCQQCQSYASRMLGGAEVELTMLFADVRGSTALAEGLPAAEFSRLISHYFAVTAAVLADHHAWVDRFVGDQAVGYFVPGFAGNDHAAKALAAAGEILRQTGHGTPGGAWLPVGIGVHTGVAFVGSVGAAGQATDITALGDAPNTAARLASAARAGEILASEEALKAAGLPADGLERRELALKGKSQSVRVYVIHEMLSIEGR
jgi:adenylate cyclase